MKGSSTLLLVALTLLCICGKFGPYFCCHFQEMRGPQEAEILGSGRQCLPKSQTPSPKYRESVDSSPSPTHPDLTPTTEDTATHPGSTQLDQTPLNPASLGEEMPLYQGMAFLPW